MTTSNSVFGFPGLAADFALSGGSWSSTFPQSNLLDDDLKRVARTADAATGSTVIKGTCATAQSVGVVSLVANNLTLSATIRLRLFSDTAWSVSIYDSTAVSPWPGGAIIDPDWIWWNGTNYAAKSFQIDIADTTNPAGYIDLGYLEIATQVEVQFQFIPGAQRGRLLRSTNSQTPGGRKIFGRRSSARIFNGTYTTEDAKLRSIFLEMWRLNDLDVPFIFIPHPDDPDNWTQDAMLCRLVDTGPMATYMANAVNQAPIKLEQVL